MSRFSPLLAGAFLLAAMVPAQAQFVINEFMADNLTSTNIDEDTQREDWIEIQNNGTTTASLNGWYLTDDAAALRKWQFPVTTPAVTLAAGARLTVWASGKNRKASATRLHANFKLSSEGEFLALVRPDGVTIEDGYTPAYPPQFPNGTYGRSGTAPAEIGYLTTSTRGLVNSSIKTAVGPGLSATTDRPAQPGGGPASAPLLITTSVTQTLRPLADVEPVVLRWRRLYQPESSLTMKDDGTGGDVLAGDGVYSALVPTTSLMPGEMIRWRVQAKDNSATPVYSYDPPYPGFSATSPPPASPTVVSNIEAEQYFGTMAIPPDHGTSTPVLYWFLNGTDNSVNNTGSRCSFFWQPLPRDNPPAGYVPPRPRFYDNVMADLHGQSSAGFPKKSHDLSFSKDNRFLWKDGTPETSGINLLTNYADKSKVRNPVVWWIWEKTGHFASHYDTLVRVHQNGTFKGLYDIVENGNGAFLERAGLDRAGALYKVYDQLAATSGSEKKNPDNTDVSDLNALINGLSPAQTTTVRLRYLYDNVNVPGLINFLATHSLILNRDFGHKNYYMHRDTNGTREWTPVPWDQDLSLGHTWNSAQNYFDDDIHSQAALQIGVSGNRLIQLVYTTPELNHMFVRRLRSLADQFLVSPTEMNGPIAQRIASLIQQIDPVPDNTATGTDDADLEARAWGFWVDGNSTKIAYTDPRMPAHTARAQALRITTANPNPPNGGNTPYDDGTTTKLAFLPGRRDFFFKTPPPVSPGSGAVSQTLPASQPPVPGVIIEQITPAPLTGTYQDQEFFVIRNPNAYAVDLSGWTLSGDIKMTFQGGTVIPAQGRATTQAVNAAYVNQLTVANAPAGIRARTVSPMGNQYRLVTGPYQGQLSGRGGSFSLNRPNNPMDPAAGTTLVQTVTYPGAPTPHQETLRITELNFRPAPPTPAEQAALPGVLAGDFEFIELTNTGTADLELGGAYFEDGVEFTFPSPFLLAAGQRCLVVASPSAFEIRYGTGHRIAGEFTGALNNGGEKLRLVDPYGEEVLSFTYDDDWMPLPAGQFRSFVISQPLPGYADYGKAMSWQLSSSPAGSPGAADTTWSLLYESWRNRHFTEAMLPTASQPVTMASPMEDPDGDGWNNFQEYAFAGNPMEASSRPSVTSGILTLGSDRFLTITFDRSMEAMDLSYTVECTGNLTTGVWQPQAVLEGTPVPLGSGWERVTYRDTVPLGQTSRRYVRAAARR